MPSTSTPKRPARLTSGAVNSPSEKPSPIRLRLMWFMFFRAVVLSTLLVSTIFVHAGEGSDLFDRYVVGIYVVCVTGFAAILLGAIWIRYFGDKHLERVAYAQLTADTVIACALSILTGGVSSAFVFLFFLTILNAAVVLGRRATFLTALGSFFVFCLLFVAQVLGALTGVGINAPASAWSLATTFTMNTLALFLIAALADFLNNQLVRANQTLSETQESLEQLEEIHGSVLESLPSGVLTVDKSGEVIFINEAGARIFNEVSAALIGRPLDSIFDQSESLLNNQRFERHLPSGQILGGTVSVLAGDIDGRVVIFQDLTELRKLQEDVSRDDRLATVGRFAAGLAHEIRNPLASMIGCLDLLRIDIDDAEDSKMLSIVQKEAQRLNGLVTEFLTYARPAPVQKQSVDLRELVDETVRAFKTTAPSFQLNVEGAPTLFVPIDAAKIRQVLWNLLGNAKDAMARVEEDDHQPVILISLFGLDTFVRITVDDNGPGIAKEQSQNIFEPFFTTRERGTGLGLSTCHQVIEQHQGRIRVGSNGMNGARFEVILPHDSEIDDSELTQSSGQWYSSPRTSET